ncbi:anti-sigma factor domain-containing protein [Brachybacterium sp. UNK5269]|uniref:anti-sigma factor n=1 Tax=Brachybacterium sp. UNK5269 TaxID=3408576 RepID=UPI003BAEC837
MTSAHPAPEQLSAVAVGDPVPAAITEHLESCAPCRRELETIARVLDALVEPVALEEPPAGLWERIQQGLDAPADPATAPAPAARPLPATGPAGGDEDETDDATAAAAPPPSAPAATRDELAARRRRRPRWSLVAVAAAAGLVLGAGGAALLGGTLGGDEEQPSPTPPPVAKVGEAVLDPVTEDDVRGTAEMVSSEADGDQLVVSVSTLPAEGYYEVWLRDAAASRLISLGTVSAETTTLPVPAGVDLEQFPIVDVSQEHFDGDPSHSGVTVAAGPMTVADAAG